MADVGDIIVITLTTLNTEVAEPLLSFFVNGFNATSSVLPQSASSQFIVSVTVSQAMTKGYIDLAVLISDRAGNRLLLTSNQITSGIDTVIGIVM